jgi:hypothetical protein
VGQAPQPHHPAQDFPRRAVQLPARAASLTDLTERVVRLQPPAAAAAAAAAGEQEADAEAAEVEAPLAPRSTRLSHTPLSRPGPEPSRLPRLCLLWDQEAPAQAVSLTRSQHTASAPLSPWP